MFSIIDIETNGLNNSRGKITEIAIYKHNGKKVIDSYQTLINPESTIPQDISRLTGITNQMVKDAPKFYEVAKTIEKFTKNCVFVAHNVNFDYRFIQKEFKELGFDFKREKVCTVRQSRLLIPGKRSYSLGKLCTELGITINDRHRADGDAKATVQLFEILLSIDQDLGLKTPKKDQLSKYLHPSLDLNKVLDAPTDTGVYYLLNENKEIIYVGKSVNIRTRLYNHLRQPKTDKAISMHTQVADIDFELTGSELVALLKENLAIKQLKPKYNYALKRNSFKYGIYTRTDLFGYVLFEVKKIESNTTPLALFSSQQKAKAILEKLSSEFGLCLGLLGLQSCSSGCIQHATNSCSGAALYNEPYEEYNKKAMKAIGHLSPLQKDILLIDKGHSEEDQWAILVQNGEFCGFTSFNPEFTTNLEYLIDDIRHVESDPDSKHIIASYLRRKKVKQIINL